jgi:hypothetical protein
MAASTAKIASGTTLQVENAAGTGIYTTIAEIRSVNKPSASVDEVEVTHMTSPGLAKEFIAGLTDYGEVEFDINWIPSNATDLFLEAWRSDGINRSVKITYPGPAVDTFQAFLKGYEAGASSPGDALQGKLTLRVAGAVTRS